MGNLKQDVWQEWSQNSLKRLRCALTDGVRQRMMDWKRLMRQQGTQFD